MLKRLLHALSLLSIIAAALVFSALAEGAAVPPDGLYTVGVTSSSNMFRVTHCVLDVKGGTITATLTLSGHGYGYLYTGTGAEADQAPRRDWVPFAEDADGAYSYSIVVPALDVDTSVAAYSTKYSKWYDRTLRFQSGSLTPYERVPADGAYAVKAASDTLETDACTLAVKDGAMTVRLAIPGYEALRADGAEYPDEDGVFAFPLASLDRAASLEVRAAAGAWTAHIVRFSSASLERLTVVPDEGVYTIAAASDSNLFAVSGCRLSVADGVMTALVTVGNARYDIVFPGTAKDAPQAERNALIPAIPDADGAYTYALPLEALDAAVEIATWSAKSGKWYDRTLTFDSATLVPADGAAASAAP